MKSQGLDCASPRPSPNLKGDDARAAFIKQFKEVQRLKTQLDQYTDLTDEQKQEIEQILPKDEPDAFRGAYLETAQRLREQQAKPAATADRQPARSTSSISSSSSSPRPSSTTTTS